MKKLLILPAAAMLLGLGVAAGVSKAPVVEVKADSVSTATVDITGKTWLKASEGTMVSVPNWKTSGLGVSFEVKYSNPTSIANNTVFNFFSGSTKISGNIYLADFGAATKDSVNNLIKARDSYHRVAVVDAAEGWIRYDILFKDAPAIAGQESATVDAINFIWYGNPFVQMRNLQVISEFRTLGDTPVAYNKTNTAGYLKGGYDEFPKIANWSTSGLGFSLEFKPTEEKDTLISLLDNSYAAVASGNDYMYRKNNSGNPSKGKIFALANGWYRYEAMLSEFGAVAGKEAETLTMINLVKWEASGYNCKPEYRNVKVISRYSTADETTAGTYADNFMTRTDSVCVADGSTNVINLQAKLAESKAEYDAMTPQAKVLVTYSDKVVDATVKGKVDAANERYAYIYSKYSDVINFTSLNLTRSNAKGLFTTFTNENNNMYFVAIAAVAVLPLAAIPFAKKKHN